MIALEGLDRTLTYPEQWIVDCKAVGSGEKAIAYLGRYLYRGVIAQKDIVSCENGQVTYRFQNSKTKCTEYRTVPGAKFLWMILRHVLRGVFAEHVIMASFIRTVNA